MSTAFWLSKSSSSSNSSTKASPQAAAEHQIRDVFTSVLEEAGRTGYASAQALSEDASLEKEITSSWGGWFEEFGRTHYTYQAGSESPSVRKDKTAVDLKQDYGRILSNAYAKGGYATPSTYLKSLSAEDLGAIQQVQHLADPINVANLSEEASLNLLLPPGTQVDENRDGLTAIGAAYTIQFPNSNTPKDVSDAWEAAIADVPESQRLTFEFQACMPLITANIHCDANGNFIRSSNPGDADWVNPMASPSYSYKDAADNWLDYLDQFKNQIPAEQYQRDLGFWTAFRDALSR